ncbi:unnamed protein product [Rotaria socialis]|uniref:Uncharacterized protein n=1 Tax=Rotaria socialis TaxID=392032 RepID=A0A817ZDN4_9BILA|nr:unnamed protein product [Rotaria socialis]CAF3288665.1 unnamed protein product [Rotaria socialis]CAF3389852.1 unnamed protein product [Rotaria socialis]CAF3464078.1 unnamed protein product [Rotaria socialis]CAF4279374.1 unnamed protein product [Rotaria socialis]
MGNRCEASTNVVQFPLTFAIQWDIETADVNLNFNIPEFIYTFAVAAMLVMALTNNIASCNVIPVIVIIMVDICMWLSSALIAECVLLECFNFSRYRSRRFAVISSISGTILTIGTHFHEIIARRPLPDPIRA